MTSRGTLEETSNYEHRIKMGIEPNHGDRFIKLLGYSRDDFFEKFSKLDLDWQNYYNLQMHYLEDSQFAVFTNGRLYHHALPGLEMNAIHETMSKDLMFGYEQ